MDPIIELLGRIEYLGKHPYAIINSVFRNPDLQRKIIELNTRKQLFEQGIDSTGKSLEDIGGPYSPNTIEGTPQYKGKKELGLPYDHITLYSTGEFHRSWRFIMKFGADNDEFSFEVDPIKDDGTNLLIEWGPDIVGLTQESKDQILDWTQDEIVEATKDFIMSGSGNTLLHFISVA